MTNTRAVLLGLALTAVLVLGSVTARAATLTGDTVTLQYGFINGPVVVGPGIDLSLMSSLDFDFDAGTNGNEFVLSFNPDYEGPRNALGVTSFGLLDLDFSGNEILTNFLVLDNELANLVPTVNSHSVTFTLTSGFPNAPLAQGAVILRGQFVTAPEGVATPEPSTLWLALAGLVGLVFIHRHRSNGYKNS